MPRVMWRRIVDDDDEEMPGPSRSQTQNRRRRNSDDDMFAIPTQSQKSQGRRKAGASQSQNRRKRTDDDDDDDISFVSNQSQRSQGRRKSRSQNTQFDNDSSQTPSSQSRSQKGIPEDELNRLMGHVVRYILVSDRSRHPILRQNIQKSILDNSKHYRLIMDCTKATLHKVFGYKLVDLDNGKYILVNDIRNNQLSFQTEKSQMVLLFICLSHIFMNDEVCSEDNLFNFLRKLRIVEGDNFKDEYFGDVYQLITVEFIKQRYLVRSKVDNSEPEKFEYQWGPRAEQELDKFEILQFVSKIYRNRPVQEWTSQLKNIEQSNIVNSQIQVVD